MFSCLMKLPNELVQRIISAAEISDLKNLSCCSRQMYELSKKRLWKRIKIQWKWLYDIDWTNDLRVRQLENLQHTRSISFVDDSKDLWFLTSDTRSETFGDLMPLHRLCQTQDDLFWFSSPPDLLTHAQKIVSNYIKFLTYFKVHEVKKFSTRRGGVNLINGCKKFRSMKELSLTYSKHCFDVGPSFLGEFTTLETLKVASTSFPDEAIDFISTSLRELDLTATPITDVALEKLGKLKALDTLSISDCVRVTEAGFHHLSKLTCLETLKASKLALSKSEQRVLDDWKIADSWIYHLQDIPCLRTLCLSYCKDLTDISLEYFSNMRSLQSLDIYYAGGFSEKAVENLSSHVSLVTLKYHVRTLSFGRVQLI